MFDVRRNVRHAVRLAITSTVAAASTAALSQTATETAGTGNELEEIVITGTRIHASPNDVSAAPVATITAADIEKTGLLRVEDILNTLPQFVAENNSGQSLSSDGTATLSLRGLGSWETLVLINGRRMQPGGSPFSVSSADINQIPAAMIERVDVLTGGASSTYGADAVAGVVNFIMNTHFEGVKVDFDYGFNQHSNNSDVALTAMESAGVAVPGSFQGGQNRDWSIVIGAKFADGKGNATVYGTYLNTAPVVGYQLEYAACTLTSADGPPKGGAPWDPIACGGSSSSATGRFLLYGATAHGSTAILADGTVDKISGRFRRYTSADNYNYGSLSYAQREAQRYTAGAFLNYDVNENMNVYSETMYALNTSRAQYGPSGLFAFGYPSMSCANPLLNPSELAALCMPAAIAANQAIFGGTDDRITLVAARRSVESGVRTDNYTSNSIREVIGTTGAINEAWSYDAYGQYGISNFGDVEGGYLGLAQIYNALDVVANPAVGGIAGVPAGTPVCASAVTGVNPTCVPWNIWNNGGVTPSQLNYLVTQSTYTANATEYIVNGSVTGDLGKYGVRVPTASDPVIVNLGTEYRQESLAFNPDYVYSHGLASGGNSITPVNGNFHVNEYFVEVKAPLIDNRPGAYHLGFEGGYRYSDYTSGFKTDTYKLGLEWAPVQELKLRGSYNRAVRAPNITDLYAPKTPDGGNADPCWGPAPHFSMAQCQLTGLDPSKYRNLLPNPAEGINATSGGNPNLQPEKADTYTVGFVLQPVAFRSLVMSVDYYHISIDDTIAGIGTDTIFDVCAATGDPVYCSRIHRDPRTGSLWFNNAYYVDTSTLNIGRVTTAGYDIAARYNMHAGSMGKLNFSFMGTKVTDASIQPTPISASFDCTGLYGTSCNAPTPKWKHIFETDWTTPWAGLVLTGRWRYTGPVNVDASSPNPQLSSVYQPGFGHIGGYDYIDLSASISWGRNLNFRVGANNVFDKSPPIVLSGNLANCPSTTCNDNTWVGTYDTLGRYIYAHITANF